MPDDEQKIYILPNNGTGWQTGNVITADRMNDIGNVLHYTSEEIVNATKSGHTIEDTPNNILQKKLENMVKYFNEPPQRDSDLQYTRLYAEASTGNNIIVPTQEQYLKFKNVFVSPFDKNKNYQIGDYIQYNDQVYKVVAAITANTSATEQVAWEAINDKINKINVMEEVANLITFYTEDSQLNQAINNRFYIKNQNEEEIQLPTLEEFNELKQSVENNIIGSGGLPSVTIADENKVLQVKNGEWTISDSIKKKFDKLTIQIGSVESLSWAERMEYIRNGQGAETFPVGTRFSTLHSKLGNIQWDVVDHDHFQLPSDGQAHTMTLMTRFILPINFNATILNHQCALFAATTAALPAGNYKFTGHCHFVVPANNNKVFYFSLPDSLPVGGQIRPYMWGATSTILGTDILAAYETAESTEPLFTIDVTATALGDAVDLEDVQGGTYQFSGYTINGAFDYSTTDLREWLNSSEDAGAWRTLKTPLHHVPYPNAYNKRSLTDWFENTDGFMKGFGTDFMQCVQEIDYPCVAPYSSVTHEPGEFYTARDRFIIPSAAELGASQTPIIGSAFKFFENTDNTKRIKYKNVNSKNGTTYPTRTAINNSGQYGAGLRHIIPTGDVAIYMPANFNIVVMCTLA